MVKGETHREAEQDRGKDEEEEDGRRRRGHHHPVAAGGRRLPPRAPTKPSSPYTPNMRTTHLVNVVKGRRLIG